MTHRIGQSNKSAALMLDDNYRNFKSILWTDISNCKQSEAKRYQSPFRRVLQFPEFCIAENCQKSCRKWLPNRNLQTENLSAIDNSTMPPTVINITWGNAVEKSKNRPLGIHLSLQYWCKTTITEILNQSCGQTNISNCKQSEAKISITFPTGIAIPWILHSRKLPEILPKMIWLPNRNLQTENVSAIDNSTMPPTVINITWGDAGERSKNRPLSIHLSLQLCWPFVFVYKHQSHPSPQQ